MQFKPCTSVGRHGNETGDNSNISALVKPSEKL